MAVYWRACAPTPIWNTSTGSRTAPLERMLGAGFGPEVADLPAEVVTPFDGRVFSVTDPHAWLDAAH